jgi:hypothetical protein
MAICLISSLMAKAQARLLTNCNKYTFKGVEYTLLMYKVIMRLATMITVATTHTLQENLQNLEVYVATANRDINKIHGEFDKNYSQPLAHSATINDFNELLLKAYNLVSC